jgi:hypothetical protein
MILDKVHLLFRIRIHSLKIRIRIWIRILQKVSDPYGSESGSGSTTLKMLLLQIGGVRLPQRLSPTSESSQHSQVKKQGIIKGVGDNVGGSGSDL